MAAADPVALCLAGAISPPVMLARLVLSGRSDAAIEQELAARGDAAPLLAFFRRHAHGLERLRHAAAQVDHTRHADPPHVAAQYDAALSIAPEASVAAYSLGDPALLEAATQEIVGWLRGQALFRPGMDVLDLGCGFGRIAAALAPMAGSVLGLDVSSRMIAEGRRRYGGLPRLRLAVTSGSGLEQLPDHGFDLVLAVDSFPYLLQAGDAVAHRHVRDLARSVRPGGRIAVLNLSYGSDPGDDATRVAQWATGEGLRVQCRDVTPFQLWDARVFVFARPHRLVRSETPGLAPGTDATWQRLEDPG